MVHIEFHNWRQEFYAAALARRSQGGHKVTIISTLRDRTPVPQPEELDEGQILWGKPSSFSWGKNAGDFDEGIVPSTRWEYGDDPEDPGEEDPEPEELREEWMEVDRKETMVRIDGPDGAYVDFMRVDEVTFKLPTLPDGREHYVVQRFKASST